MTTMADRDGFIWLDGEMVPWREATTHVLTHTLHYGMGVFEGVRAYQGERGTAIFRLQEHTDRLFNSAHILGMSIPYDRATISDAHRTDTWQPIPAPVWPDITADCSARSESTDG